MRVRRVVAHHVEGDASELRPRAKALAPDRKILRLLHDGAYAPFVCTLEGLRQVSGVDSESVALYVVADYDLDPMQLIRVPDAASAEQVARACFEVTDPTNWVRLMPNSMICMTSIAAGLRGPSMHLVGAGATVRQALLLAQQALSDGLASMALVSGWTTSRRDGAGAESDLFGFVLATDDEPSSEGDVFDLDVGDAQSFDHLSAVEAVRRCAELRAAAM